MATSSTNINKEDNENAISIESMSANKPKRRDHTLSKGLFNAINDGNLDEVRQLLTQTNPKQLNKCVRTKNSGHHVTPLLWAVYNRQEQIGKLLIEKGANVNKAGTNEENSILFNYTPLLKAIENGDENMVMLLVENGANVHLKAPGPRQAEEEGGSMAYVKWMYPMNLALQLGNFNILKVLMQKFDVIRIYDEGRHTCLCRAATMFDLDIIQYLISRGAKMCRGEGNQNDAYSTPGICQIFKSLIHNSFSIKFMQGSGITYITEQNSFRCLMSISLTDYARAGSAIHRAVSQYTCMCFTETTQGTSLSEPRDSKCSKSDGGFDWLLRLSSSPSKLKHICRIVIREVMYKKLPENIEFLPLPKKIIQYLLCEEDFNIINDFDLGKGGHYKDLTV